MAALLSCRVIDDLQGDGEVRGVVHFDDLIWV